MAVWGAAAVWLALAAIGVLVFGVLRFIRAARSLLARVGQTVDRLDNETLALIRELRALTAQASDMNAVVFGQLKRVEKLVSASEQLGEAVERSAKSVRFVARAVDDLAGRNLQRATGAGKQKFGEALTWAELGWTAWKWWETKRTEAAAVPVRPKRDEERDKFERSE